MLRRYARLAGALASLVIALSGARTAHGWATAEHVRFGQQIARPFEQRVLIERLPVIAPMGGPQTFGHWVSAPDFARGLRGFLTMDPVLGGTPCGELWNPEGVVDGVEIDDQGSILDNLGYLDCVDTWRMNNSHFGDFAAYHYAAYHAAALEAARRYWRTRQPVCREAAYTLEGWGEHYLTDATAAGHAWNPAGTYDSGFDWQTTNSITQRMRIHNALNGNGARLAGSLYALGRIWGDHSEQHLSASVPELPGDAQNALTLHLARMSLAQVVMAGECGGPVDAADVFGGGDAARDPRRMYVSDESMCAVMHGEEIGTWSPDWWEDLGVDMADVQAVVDRCRAGGGVLGSGKDGALLAVHWFQDKYYQASPVDGVVSATIDPNAAIRPDDLGCTDDLPVVPLIEGERDACGMERCATPPAADGTCPAGHVVEAACCLPVPAALGDDGGAVTVTPWRSSAPAPLTVLGATGAIAGESPELLWFEGAPAVAGGTPVRIDQAETATLTSPITLPGCGAQASYTVHEARVVLPSSPGLAETFVDLRLTGMDEGLRIEVDGRAVRYLARRDLERAGGTLVVPLFGQALPRQAGAHVVRLVHLNDCEASRPLVVKLEARGPIDTGKPVDDPLGDRDGDGEGPDGAGDPAGGCGCGASGDGAGVLLALGVGAVLVRGRRRRR